MKFLIECVDKTVRPGFDLWVSVGWLWGQVRASNTNHTSTWQSWQSLISQNEALTAIAVVRARSVAWACAFSPHFPLFSPAIGAVYRRYEQRVSCTVWDNVCVAFDVRVFASVSLLFDHIPMSSVWICACPVPLPATQMGVVLTKGRGGMRVAVRWRLSGDRENTSRTSS